MTGRGTDKVLGTAPEHTVTTPMTECSLQA